MTEATKGPLYRVDKFRVPADARAEFLAVIGRTHALLRKQKGFLGDRILEQESGPGQFNIVTIAEWADADAVAAAGLAVGQLHRTMGFDKSEALPRLGVMPDMALYREIGL